MAIPRLYRYRTWSSNTQAECDKEYVYLQKPVNFNDPLDCRMEYDDEISVTEYASWMLKQAIEDPPAGAGMEFYLDAATYVTQVLLSGSIPTDQRRTMLSQAQQEMTAVRKVFCVCCFTTNPKSVVMWSHYADEHKGVCIEYNFDDNPLATFLVPVNYVTDFPRFALCDVLFRRRFKEALRAKHRDWAYEQEWRIVVGDLELEALSGAPADSAASPPNREAPLKIKRVILGAKAEQAVRKKVNAAAAKNHFEMCTARFAPNAYDLEIGP